MNDHYRNITFVISIMKIITCFVLARSSKPKILHLSLIDSSVALLALSDFLSLNLPALLTSTCSHLASSSKNEDFIQSESDFILSCFLQGSFAHFLLTQSSAFLKLLEPRVIFLLLLCRFSGAHDLVLGNGKSFQLTLQCQRSKRILNII